MLNFLIFIGCLMMLINMIMIIRIVYHTFRIRKKEKMTPTQFSMENRKSTKPVPEKNNCPKGRVNIAK